MYIHVLQRPSRKGDRGPSQMRKCTLSRVA